MKSSRDSMLCASCDQCRSRKTRCDGLQPCGACKLKYMRKHKLNNVDGIDPSSFNCVYSPSKRRGPVPGVVNKQFDEFCAVSDGDIERSVSSNQSIKARPRRPSKERSQQGMGGGGGGIGGDGMDKTIASAMTNAVVNGRRKLGDGTFRRGGGGNNNSFPLPPPLDPRAAAMQEHVLSTLGSIGMNMFHQPSSFLGINGTGKGGVDYVGGWQQQQQQQQQDQDIIATAQNSAQKQLAYVQQLQLQQQIQAQRHRRSMNAAALSASQRSGDSGGTMNSFDYIYFANESVVGDGDGRYQLRSPLPPVPLNVKSTATSSKQFPSKRVIGCVHPKVLQYLPLTNPTNPSGMHLRACYTLSVGGLFGLPPIPTDEEYCRRFKSLEIYQLPNFDVAALQAVRFSELAMGALTTIKDGDMELLVALANASVLCLQSCVEEQVHPSLMLDVARAYFFHSTFRLYMGDMERYFKYRRICFRYLSQLDGITGVNLLMAAISFQDSLVYMTYNASEDFVPYIDGDIPRVGELGAVTLTDSEKKYGIATKPSRVASNPINQIWIQGIPPVHINERASSKSRVLDALACAIRSDVDEAKSRQAKEQIQTSTERIVSRKRKFLSDAEAKDKSATEWAVEHHQDELSISCLLAEASDLLTDENQSSLASHSIFCGLRLLVTALDIILNTESDSLDIESIFNVLESVLERPILLFQGGPTYHIINCCTILLAHRINKLQHGDFGSAQFQKALSVYDGSRMMLEKHRSKLPQRLRCRKLPTLNPAPRNGGPVIDLSGASSCMSQNLQDCTFDDMFAKEGAGTIATRDQSKMQTYKSEELDINDNAFMTVLSGIISKEIEI